MPSSFGSRALGGFYPIAREAPVLAALALAVLRLGEQLAPAAALWVGLAGNRQSLFVVVLAGLGCLAIRKAWSGHLRTRIRRRIVVVGADRLLHSTGAVEGRRGVEAAHPVAEASIAVSRLAVEHLPEALGSVGASLVLSLFAARAAGLTPLLLLAGVAFAGMVLPILVVVPRALQAERTAAASWFAFGGRLATLAQASLEIASMGRGPAALRALEERGERWQLATSRAERLGAVAQHAPAGALLIAGSLLLPQLPVATAALASLAGYALLTGARSGLAAARLARGLYSFRLLLEEPELPKGGTTACPKIAPTISAVGLCVSLGPSGSRHPVLREISFTARPGEVLVIRGDNGSGKTTLLRTIAGLLPAESGSLTVDGIALNDLQLANFRQSLAFVPQRPFLPEAFSLEEALRSVGAEPNKEALQSALNDLGLLRHLERIAKEHPLDAPVRALSVGQLQLLMIATAWASGKSLILMDEPDAVLSGKAIHDFLTALHRVASEKTVLLTTHSEAFSDFQGSTQTLILSNPGTCH